MCELCISGPPVVRPSTTGVTTDGFVSTASLRNRLARSQTTTTTVTSTAGLQDNYSEMVVLNEVCGY